MTITLWDSLIIFIIAYVLLFFITGYLIKKFAPFHCPAWMVPRLERDVVLLFMSTRGRVVKVIKIEEVKNLGAFSHLATRTKLYWLGIRFVSTLSNVKTLGKELSGKAL
jgi:hypothetical protein